MADVVAAEKRESKLLWNAGMTPLFTAIYNSFFALTRTHVRFYNEVPASDHTAHDHQWRSLSKQESGTIHTGWQQGFAASEWPAGTHQSF